MKADRVDYWLGRLLDVLCGIGLVCLALVVWATYGKLWGGL